MPGLLHPVWLHIRMQVGCGVWGGGRGVGVGVGWWWWVGGFGVRGGSSWVGWGGVGGWYILFNLSYECMRLIYQVWLMVRMHGADQAGLTYPKNAGGWCITIFTDKNSGNFYIRIDLYECRGYNKFNLSYDLANKLLTSMVAMSLGLLLT